MLKLIAKVTTLTGCLITIEFGVWALFVPRVYDWYRYVNDRATDRFSLWGQLLAMVGLWGLRVGIALES
jgi:hypothetical protein